MVIYVREEKNRGETGRDDKNHIEMFARGRKVFRDGWRGKKCRGSAENLAKTPGYNYYILQLPPSSAAAAAAPAAARPEFLAGLHCLGHLSTSAYKISFTRKCLGESEEQAKGKKACLSEKREVEE